MTRKLQTSKLEENSVILAATIQTRTSKAVYLGNTCKKLEQISTYSNDITSIYKKILLLNFSARLTNVFSPRKENSSGSSYTSENSYLKSFLDLPSEQTISRYQIIEYNSPKASSGQWEPRLAWTSTSETETLSSCFTLEESDKTSLK